MSPRPLRALALAATTLALAVGTVPATAASPSDADKAVGARAKAASAANWQASQLTKGRIHNGQFNYDDWGLTIDSVFALVAQGGHRKDIARSATAIERNYFANYAAAGGDRYAGSMAKVLLLTAVLGDDATDFGGRNVRHQVLQLVAGSGEGFEAGRLRDVSDFGEFSNTFAQAFGVLGLVRTGTVSQDVVDYLLKQQCEDGYFRIDEIAGETCDDSGSPSDVDATALAIQALLAVRGTDVTVPAGTVKAAATWLISAQRANGSFVGGTPTTVPNTNSTGLAAVALQATGHPQARAKAAAYVASMQFTRANTEGAAQRDIGAIAYDRAGLKNGLKNGIQKVERDQFRRATAMATLAFVPEPLGTLSR